MPTAMQAEHLKLNDARVERMKLKAVWAERMGLRAAQAENFKVMAVPVRLKVKTARAEHNQPAGHVGQEQETKMPCVRCA